MSSPDPMPTSSPDAAPVDVRVHGSAVHSYASVSEELGSSENDRLLSAAEQPVLFLQPAEDATPPAHREKNGVLSRLTRFLPSFQLPHYVPSEYPAFRWQQFGRVRLPEDEESARGQPAPESRFADCWAAVKKRQFHLRWWQYALIVLIILAATVPPIVVSIVRHVRRRPYFHSAPGPRCTNPAEFSVVLDKSVHSHGRQQYLHAATSSFSIPADVPSLGLTTTASHGSIHFVLDNSTDHADPKNRSITVDVTAYMDDWNAFQRDLVVCRSGPYGGRVNSGVNIQSRNAFMIPDVRSAFDVTIHLPAGTPTSPMRLQSVFAHIQDFEVSIDDLQDRVTFDYFNLNSMNMPVHAGSLVARSALYVHSSNAPISGSFKAIGITLDAANGEITANASIASARDGHSFLRPSVRLFSTNRAIAANVSLASQATVGGNNIQVEARTTHAPIDLAIAAAPETARMAVSTRNQFAPTRVALPDTYVGDFALYTMRGWQQPAVHFDQEHDARGRAMRVSSFSDHRVSGDVRGPGSSSPPPPPTRFELRNRVSMSAQNGDLDLYL